jgi:hypoxanthine phosphoribosyltransferase
MNNVINEIKQSMETTLLDSKNILVMDDILDSGATMAELKVIFEKLHDMQVVKELDNIKYATLYYNYANNAEFIPDYYARQIDKSLRDDWIVFPFEQWWKE